MCTWHPCRHVAGADILYVGGERGCGEGAYMTAKGSLWTVTYKYGPLHNYFNMHVVHAPGPSQNVRNIVHDFS